MTTRRLVFVVLGQSNAANYGATMRLAGAGVYVFANGKLHVACDPLPGGDGKGGSIWTRLGPRLIASGNYDTVVFAIVARGSRRVDDFRAGGSEFARLNNILQQLAEVNLPPTAILWQQGETEGVNPQSTFLAYQTALTDVVSVCHDRFPATPFVVAQATRMAATPPKESIRLAQTSVATMPGCAAGPDFDALDETYRADGTHFNDRGLATAADLWAGALSRTLLPAKEHATAP